MSYVDKKLLRDIIREVAHVDSDEIDYSDEDGDIDDFNFESWDSFIIAVYIEERYGK